MKVLLSLPLCLLLSSALAANLSDNFCTNVKSGKVKARCCFKMVFTSDAVNLAASSVTCTPKSKKIKSLRQVFKGTKGYTFNMVLAINQGKGRGAKSSIRSAEITGKPPPQQPQPPQLQQLQQPQL